MSSQPQTLRGVICQRYWPLSASVSHESYEEERKIGLNYMLVLFK